MNIIEKIFKIKNNFKRRKGFICPRCGEYSTDYPALSRVDSDMNICSSCGIEESLLCMKYTRKNFLQISEK